MSARAAVAAVLLVCVVGSSAIAEPRASHLVLHRDAAPSRSSPSQSGMAMGMMRTELLRNVMRSGLNSALPLVRASRVRAAGRLALRSASGAGFVRAGTKTLIRGSQTLIRGSGTLIRKIPSKWNTMMTKYPLHVCGGLEGLRYLAGDVIAQRIEQGKALGDSKDSKDLKIDWTRLGIFTFWGVWYGAGLGYWSYHELYPALYGCVGMRAALATAATDVFLTCPFVYYPIWHCYKLAADKWQNEPGWLDGVRRASSEGAVAAAGAIGRCGHDLAKEAAGVYKSTFVQDNLAMICVWMPLHVLNFRFIPLQHRFPFIAVTGLIWTTTFSYLQFS